MPVTLAELHEVFAAGFPVRAERASLEYVETVTQNDGFGVVVRLIIWDIAADGETMSIRDVKEQQVWFDPRDSSVERLTAYLRAFDYVASRALTHSEIETLMPHDLFISNVLELARAQTEEQFVKALSVKSRLGRYLPAI